MHREFYDVLLRWRHRDERKPLLLQGIRQVGKTYLLERLRRSEFERSVRIDFLEDPKAAALFAQDVLPERIVRELSLYTRVDLDLDHDLIIFDEIQACPRALTALKYFAERHPRAFVCGSGSLLGVGLTQGSFPVGKVERHTLYPMTFSEFLCALGEDALAQRLDSASLEDPIQEPIHSTYWGHLKTYFVTGGLPEVVATYAGLHERPNQAFAAVRELQTELLSGYGDDIAKHAGKLESVSIDAVLKSIPRQLARAHEGPSKFVFKGVLPTASRYSSLAGPIEWLVQAGMAHQVPICNRAEAPLAAHAAERRFKLYLGDVGLLGAMVGLRPHAISAYDYGDYKGYFAENFVLNEHLARSAEALYAWQEGTSEIEFLLQSDNGVVPVEVKAGLNTKAKSLAVFRGKYPVHAALLLSASPMGSSPTAGGRWLLPLYLAGRLDAIVNRGGRSRAFDPMPVK